MLKQDSTSHDIFIGFMGNSPKNMEIAHVQTTPSVNLKFNVFDSDGTVSLQPVTDLFVSHDGTNLLGFGFTSSMNL